MSRFGILRCIRTERVRDLRTVIAFEGHGRGADVVPGRRPVPRAGGCCCGGVLRGRGSGGDGAADGDRRGCLAGGGAAPGGGECLPGFGLVVAVPVPVDDDAAPGQVAEGAGRRAAVSAAGRLAVAAPDLVVVIAARRAAVKEISRGWTGCPARRPLRAGAADRAAARAAARTSSQAVTQAACSWRIMSGVRDRKIGPVEGPAPRMADLASRSAVVR